MLCTGLIIIIQCVNFVLRVMFYSTCCHQILAVTPQTTTVNSLIRQHSLYSLVHNFHQGFFSHVRGKKNSKSLIFFSCRTFFCRFCPFYDENTTDLVKKIYTFGHVGGKNKKTHKCQFFFSSGTFSARRRNRGPKNIVGVA